MVREGSNLVAAATPELGKARDQSLHRGTTWARDGAARPLKFERACDEASSMRSPGMKGREHEIALASRVRSLALARRSHA